MPCPFHHAASPGSIAAGRSLLSLIYGAVCYALFLVVFLYAIAFAGDLPVPRSVDRGVAASPIPAVAIDLVLLSLFALQHSVMARRWFKQAWTRVVPATVERSTYVLAASLVLALIFWQWRHLPEVVWDVRNIAGRIALTAMFWGGWGLVLLSTFLIDHFQLFGLKQVILQFRGRGEPAPLFKTPVLYRFVRHPLYLGFIIAFSSALRMTAGHLLFAAVCTAYILVAIQFEERDLIHTYGEKYRQYRRQVPMILPLRSPDHSAPAWAPANNPG